MKWTVIRHGDKEKGDFYNPVLRHQDQPISAKGREQAVKLIPYFKDKTISNIYVSEYIRTTQTITPVAEKHGLTPIIDSRLNEIETGLTDGLTDEELSEQFPELWRTYQARNQDFQFPEGESGEQVLVRMKSFLSEMMPANQDIVLVAHDGWIRLLTCHILGFPVYRRWEFAVDTCGIMEIEYQPRYERWKLIRFNHVCP